MTTANGRDTRFELISLRQDANGYLVHVTERGTKAESFDLPDLLTNEMFTDAEHAVLVQAFTIIEQRAAEKYDTLVVSPEVAQAAMLAAAKAKDEAAKAIADRDAAEKAAVDAADQAVSKKQELLVLEEQRKVTDEVLAKMRAELEHIRADAAGAVAAREQSRADVMGAAAALDSIKAEVVRTNDSLVQLRKAAEKANEEAKKAQEDLEVAQKAVAAEAAKGFVK